MKRRKQVCVILAILWMAMIFSFSARNGKTSGNDSSLAGRFIGEHFVEVFSSWSSEKQQDFVNRIDYPIRKIAHGSEYFVLGIFMTGAYIDPQKKKKLQRMLPWIVGTLYAMSDEFHQLFVPGRSGKITDVMIDSTGLAIGVFVFTIIYKKLQKKS